MSRHKWEPLVPTPEIPSVYKTSICKKCGCVRLHIYAGGYFKSYLMSGKELKELPDCVQIVNQNK